MCIETDFGRFLGDYKTVNSLYSIYYHLKNADKIKIAKNELIVFLKIAKQKRLNPYEINSSWAGAFGLPQFMPTSYRDLAVDGDGDGVVDLFDIEDAIMSVANFLHKNGYAKSRVKAFYCYNKFGSQVKLIQLYSKELKKRSKMVKNRAFFYVNFCVKIVVHNLCYFLVKKYIIRVKKYLFNNNG